MQNEIYATLITVKFYIWVAYFIAMVYVHKINRINISKLCKWIDNFIYVGTYNFTENKEERLC